MKIGKNILEAREAQKLTLEHMARELNISVEEYSDIENDQKDITLNRFEAIANILSIAPADLLTLTEPTTTIKNFFINQNGNQGVNIHVQGVDQQEIRKAYKELYEEQLDKLPKLEKLLRENRIQF